KIIVYVPKDYLSDVKQALYNAGAGHIGNYSNCSFETVGKGQFKPLEESIPLIGEHNELRVFEEMKLEFIVHEEKVNEEKKKIVNIITEEKVKESINKMLNVHPYEEVAYDIYRLENVNKTLGIGRIGQLTEKTSVQLLCEEIKEKFEMKKIRVSGDIKKQ